MDDMPDGVVAYTIDNDTEKVFVAYNAGKNKITIKLADALWEVLADESSAGDKALYTIRPRQYLGYHAWLQLANVSELIYLCSLSCILNIRFSGCDTGQSILTAYS